MSDRIIIKPEITPAERSKRLSNVSNVLCIVTGYQCKYAGLDDEMNRGRKQGKRRKP
ncbi:MAG TPA: hypothetical protein VHP38_08525 [Ruminiclostridium sp.]|nr:hypothetical protein [Ruminiclostridium sp.]